MPKHNALLGSSKCQRATGKTLTLVKTSALLSEPVCWIGPRACCGPLLFPRNSTSLFVLTWSRLWHPLHQGGGAKEENLSSAQGMNMDATTNVTFTIPPLPFSFSPSSPSISILMFSFLCLRLKSSNLNSLQILICSSLPAIHYLLCCSVNSKY